MVVSIKKYLMGVESNLKLKNHQNVYVLRKKLIPKGKILTVSHQAAFCFLLGLCYNEHFSHLTY